MKRERREPPAGNMAGVVERNIRALIEQRRQEERSRTAQERVADAVTRFAGSMRFVYLHLAIFGLWVAVNLGYTPRLEFDPTFVTLAMVASVEAIFLSTFVLITQNRMSAQAERRAELDLQVSLLAEHEITRLIHLVSTIAGHLGLDAANDPELPELKQDVHPEKVLERIDLAEEQGTPQPER